MPENRHAVPDMNFPLAPEGVGDAYAKYWQATRTPPEVGAIIQRQLTATNGYISDFCNTTVPPEVYTAAILSPLANDISNQSRSMNAKRGLRAFEDVYLSNGASQESLRYVYGIATDRPVINAFWNEWVPEMYETDEERLNLLTDTYGDTEVPQRYWINKALGAKALGILDLRGSSGVNIESLLVGGAVSAQRLFSPSAKNDTATFQEVTKARSLWAPYAEFIGYDGLAMLLQSRSFELQFQNQGNEEALKRAYEIIYAMGSPATVEYRVQQMLGAIIGDHIQERVLGNMMSHGIVVGEALTNIHNLRIVWRRKSLGSLARKIAQQENTALPMDIIGATAITESPAEIGLAMRHALERIKADKRTTLAPSPSRAQALHVQGSEEYINEIQRAMSYESRDAMAKDFSIKPGAYQVAKVTFMFQQWGERDPLHVELQFNTNSDRRQARIGSSAHAAFKLTGISGDIPTKYIRLMENLFNDKQHIGDKKLSPQSGLRSDELCTKLARLAM